MKERFEPLQVEHVSQIVEIETQSFHEPWSSDSFRDVISNPHFQSLGIFIDQKLAGYIFYYTVMNELHVMNIAVHPSYRQKNCGTKLLTKIHEFGKKGKIQFAYLEVRETNEAAQALYTKLGYKKLGRRIKYYSNQEDALLMYKELQ